MTPEQLEELRNRRARLVDEMRQVADTAEQEDRSLTAEETQEFERMEGEFDSLTQRIERGERINGLAPRMDRSQALGGDDDDDSEEEPEGRATARPEYRDAFEAYLRGEDLTAEQRTTLNTATDADGGYAVPEDWGGLLESLRESNVIRTLANVIQTEGGGPLHYPRVSAAATAPAITAEEVSIADDGEAFDEVILGAFKYAKIQKASAEMVQDALFNVAEFVARRTGFDMGLSQGTHFVSGTGSGQPQGLLAGATVGVTTASPTAITLDEIIDLVYSVIGPYRGNGAFIARDATHASLRKLKDSDGQYLWQPSVQSGEPDRLMGYPIYADPAVAAVAATAVTVGFGDVNRAYTIRDAGGFAIKFLEERYADTDQVAWRVKLRTDAKIVDAAAFKTLKQHA